MDQNSQYAELEEQQTFCKNPMAFATLATRRQPLKNAFDSVN